MEDDTMMVIMMAGGKKFYTPKTTFMKWYNVSIQRTFALLQINDIYDVAEREKGGHFKLKRIERYINLPQIIYVGEFDNTYEIVD